MIKKWLTWINFCIGGIAAIFLLLACWYLFSRPAEIFVSNKLPPKTTLPKRAFVQKQEAYDAIGEPTLNLQFAPMSQQLPDLKRYLIYYGKNGRPDAVAERPLMHFAFTGNKSISSVIPGEKLYILYDRKLNPPQYVFSPNNAPTSLWMDARPAGNEAEVQVNMKGENGEIISEPQANGLFTLPEKEFVRFGGASQWEIGKNKVDATLLARQRARWFGMDQFITQHGGKEYADQVRKQRIDFGEGDGVYSVFVDLGDALIWENDHWKVVKPGPQSLGKPLLLIKKIDERLMSLELWDPEGKGKVLLNLLKSTEMATPPANLIQQFKFVGARTRTQFVFEINKERVLLTAKDWLLLTKDGWIKLTTPQEIDDYVDRKLVGPLFIFDEVEKRDDKQFLRGSLYNASRNDVQIIEIPLQQTGGLMTPGAKGDEKNGPRKGPVVGPPQNMMGAPRQPLRMDEDDSDTTSSSYSDDEESN